MLTRSTTQTGTRENIRPHLTSNCNLKRVLKIHFAYKHHAIPSFSFQGLKSLALDRVLDIHKLFTADTNKRK